MVDRVIGSGEIVIGAKADPSLDQTTQKVQRNLKQIAQDAQQSGNQVKKSMQDSSKSIAGVGVTYDNLNKTQRRVVRQIERSVVRQTAQTKSAYLDWVASTAGVENATEGLRQELRQFEQAQEQAASAGSKFVQMLKEQTETIGMTRREMLEYQATQLGVRDQAQPMIDRLFDTSGAYTAVEMSAKQTRQAMRLLPAQITDVVTSLASGMPMYLVAIQQGGQLRDSFGGFGNVLRGLRSLISPTMLAVGGLAAAGAAAYFAYERMNAGMRQINRTLIETGNAAGLSSYQIKLMSQNVSALTGTQRQAQEALNFIVSANAVSAESYEKVALAAVQWSNATGESIEDVVSQFNRLAEEPAEAFRELDKQYNFLTVSAYQQVEALLTQGRETEATKMIFDEFANAISERTPQMIEQTNLLVRAFQSLGQGAKSAFDSFLGLFDAETLEERYDDLLNTFIRLSEQQEKYAEISGVQGERLREINQRELEAVKAALVATNDLLVVKQQSIEIDKQEAAQKQFLAAANEITNANLSAQQVLQAQMIKLTEQYTNALKGQNLAEATRLQLSAAFNVQAQALVDAYLESIKTTKSVATSTRDVNAEIRESIENYKFETDAMAMNTYERELAAFARDMENKGIKENTQAWNENMEAFIQAQMARRSMQAQLDYLEREKEMLEEANRQRIKAEEDFAREAERINNQVGQSLTDALVEGGMNARDFLIKMFRTLVLRPLIQPIISGVLGAMGLGTAGAALAGTAGAEGATMGQTFSLMNAVSTLKTATDAFMGSFASMGASISNLGVELGSQFIADFGYGFSQGFTSGSGVMANAGTMAGAAANAAAGIAGGIAVGNLISGQFKVGGSQYTTTASGAVAGAVIGSIVPGIGTAIGAVIGGTLGGVINRAFGMGATTTESTGITGQMSLEGALAEQFTITKQKGGWFRSDKVRTSYEALEGDVLDRLSLTAQNVGQTVVAMAESLGMSADNIQGFSRGFTLGLMGLSEEEINQRVQEEFGYFADALAETINPELWNFKRNSESASEILTRLSTTLTTVNQSFDILGFTLYDASLAGADAAQKMIDLFGGIQAFTAATSFYYENFYSAQERADKQLEQMTELFTTMGLVLPNSRNAFRALVESAQAAGDDALFASLIQLAPAFNSLQVALDDLNQSTNAVVNSLEYYADLILSVAQDEYNAALKETDTALNKVVQALRNNLNIELKALQDNFNALTNRLNGDIDSVNKAIVNLSNASINTDEALTSLIASLQSQRDALVSAYELQITEQEKLSSAAQNSARSLQGIFDVLQDGINSLYQSIDSEANIARAFSFISESLAVARSSGAMPDQERLRGAVGIATGAITPERFASSFEMRRSGLMLQNQLIELQEIASNQLTEVEIQIQMAEEQIQLLREQIELARENYTQQVSFYEDQLNALRGIDASIKDADQAATFFYATMAAEQAAMNELQNQIIAQNSQSNLTLEELLKIGGDANLSSQELIRLALAGNSSQEIISALVAAGNISQNDLIGITESGNDIQKLLNDLVKTGNLTTDDLVKLAFAGNLTQDHISALINSGNLTADQLALLSQINNLGQQSLIDLAQAQINALNDQITIAQSNYEQDVADAQARFDEEVAYYQEQVDILRGIDTSVMSVEDAINRLSGAIAAERSAQQQLTTAQAEIDRLRNANSREQQFVGLYDTILERLPDPEGLKYWVESGVEIADATKMFIDSTENRMQEVTRMYDDILDRAPDTAGLEFWVNSANTLDQIRQGIQFSQEATQLRGFANGGYASPGMAIVGERGPELVDFQRPAMVYTNSQLRGAMGGGDTAAEVRALREENQAQSRAMVALQNRMTRLLERWDGDGLPEERMVEA